MEKNRAAFFDIDGTLFRNSLLVENFKLLTELGLLDRDIWEKEVWPTYQKYQNRKGAYEDYLDRVSKLYQENLVGLDLSTIKKYAHQTVNANKDKVYLVTSKAIKKHKDEGDLVFVISGSPDFLVREYAKLYGATESIATKYVFDEKGIFTGEIHPMWDSRHKLEAINSLTEKYNIDLSVSHAYGDTNGDFTMFEMVGFPHAINPSFELMDRLYESPKMREKTRIHVERKDVNYIFDLKDMEISFKKF